MCVCVCVCVCVVIFVCFIIILANCSDHLSTQIRGLLAGGIQSYKDAGYPLKTIAWISLVRPSLLILVYVILFAVYGC